MLHQTELQVFATWINWLQTPAGNYLCNWLQTRLDTMLADEFGYFAVQCGMSSLDGLRNNRMSHRIVLQHPLDDAPSQHPRIWVDSYAELPLASGSVDLLLLPHVLELSTEPHAILREAQRVLRSEGRLVIAGLNPWSLWGLSESLLGTWFGNSLPIECKMIALGRLRDWMRLLEFDMDRGRFGCYRPLCQTELWLERWAWMESAGDRWWPICGASYVIGAVKRSAGLRWVGLLPGRHRAIFSRPQVARI